jgi:hypothetical protein
VDAATKAGLLALLDDALDAGWPLRRACRQLELGETRAWRWLARRSRGQLADQPPGGHPMHGILADEAAEIVALFHEWGEIDRSHRKLAHRGSYLQLVWVCPHPRCDACSQLRGYIYGRRRGRDALSGGRFPSGSSTARTRSGSTTRRTSSVPAWP